MLRVQGLPQGSMPVLPTQHRATTLRAEECGLTLKRVSSSDGQTQQYIETMGQESPDHPTALQRVQKFQQLEDLLEDEAVCKGDPMLSSPSYLVSPSSSRCSSVDTVDTIDLSL